MALAEPQRQRLPNELILQVIEGLFPASVAQAAAIFPASSTITKTLLSFTRVSRATYEFSTRLLRERCMHIDSSRRLSLVLLQIAAPPLETLPPAFSLKCITSLYLRPFGKTLDDQPLAFWVRELFCEVCNTLKRLVVDLPLGSLSVYDDHLNVRPTLTDGFSRLANLEQLVFLRGYPSLIFKAPTATVDCWSLWPKLKSVVLFDAPVNSSWLWHDIANSRQLERVVLARSLGLQGTNIKEMYRSVLETNETMAQRPVKVTMADVENDLAEITTARWAEYDPDGKLTVSKYYIPTSFYGDEDATTLCCDWVKAAAVNGSIWSWEGEPVEVLSMDDGPPVPATTV
ncbi:hypothetical protein CPLU01_09369 [Colletotrichum plurivorum]|uniref:Uncharacterized protein n=1 Tax=Colletotrichum plurivorum TaxID=2175906 RepID=A0A8H6K9H2_9PEZI|nr:hypothetical protein CPLU01_09369 [Colletotrichum plurivorum]